MIADISQTQALIYLMVVVRMMSLAIILPGLSSSYITIRLRLAITLVLSAVIFAFISPDIDVTEFDKHSIFLNEFLIGTLMAITIRSIIYCLQILGSLIAQLISLSQILGPSVATESQSTISNLIVISGLTILLSLGFLEKVTVGLAHSYDVFPMGQKLDTQYALDLVLFSFQHTFELTLQLAGPFLVIALYYNIILAIVNKAMPQLLVSFIGVPAILIVAILLLMISMEVMLSVWHKSSFIFLSIVGL